MTGGHCGHCAERELTAPLPLALSCRFGWAHAQAVAQQSVGGMHRTVPVWIVATAGLGLLRRPVRSYARAHPARFTAVVAGSAVAGGILWTAGFAAVSGARTTRRLSRLSSERVVPIQISCPVGGPTIYASAHQRHVAGSWYVDGVFAWPRHRGGGSAVLTRLLTRADAAGTVLTLTALSPRVAASYRKAGFQFVLWIYLMRRQPQPGPSEAGTAAVPPAAPDIYYGLS